MATPDPEGFSLLAKVLGALAAIGVPVGGLWKWLDGRFDKKVDKHTYRNDLARIEGEQHLHRSYFSKIFDQMRENEQRAQDRHERLMERFNK